MKTSKIENDRKTVRPKENMTLKNTISFYKDLLEGLKIQWDRKYEKAIR